MQQFKARADERHVDLVMEKLTKDIRGWAYEFVDVRGRRGLGMNMVDEREQTSSNTRETPKSSGFQRSGPFLLRGQLGWDCEMQAAIEAKTSTYQERDSVNTNYSCRWPKISSPEWIASRTGSAWPTSVSLFGIDDGRVTTRL